MITEDRAARRTGLVVAAVTGSTFVVLAVVLVPWAWLPGEQVRAVEATSVFTAAQVAEFERVSWMLRLAAWGNLAIGLVAALWFGFTRTGARVVARLPGPWAVQLALGVGALSGAGFLLTLPLAARVHAVRRDNGLSNQAWGAWLQDAVVSFALGWLLTAVVVVVLMVVVRKAPRTWPAWAAGAAAALAFAGSFAYPVVVEPVLNDFTSLPAGPLRDDVFALARAEGVPIDDVLVADASRRTTTLNAYVSGLGSTRRVVLYDTLLTGLPQEEIEVIVAHELAHAKNRDILVGTTLAASGAATGIGLLGYVLTSRRLLRRCGADGPGDPRVVGVVLALAALASFVASPVENTISRAVEARADRASLEATGATETFISKQRALTLRSLSDPTPPGLTHFWFGSHPTVLQRIGLAQQLAASDDRRPNASGP